MTEADYNIMTILELHALAQEIRVKLTYNPPIQERIKLNKKLEAIEINIDERYLDCQT